MKYFLLWRKSDNRMMITDHVRKGWKTEQKTEADSWLEIGRASCRERV